MIANDGLARIGKEMTLTCSEMLFLNLPAGLTKKHYKPVWIADLQTRTSRGAWK